MWGIPMSVSGCGIVLKSLGHSKKTCQTKTPGFTKLNSVLRDEYWAFILEMRRLNKFCIEPSMIHSLDVTYTRQPTKRVTTWSPVGSGKQKSNGKTNLYTDAIVTMIHGDGMNHTPCIMFTSNPRFNPEQKNTERGNRILTEQAVAFDKFSISRDRVVYKQGSNYTGESPELYEHFLHHYEAKGKLGRADLFLHDGGRAYKRGTMSIFDTLGFINHVVFPSDVHQYLSPNDNKLHGCKATWSEEYHEIGDSLSAPLRLMELIDFDTVNNSRTYFRNNLFEVKKSHLKGIIGE
jgi:hypothetical protein